MSKSRYPRSERLGAAAVEFAIVAPFLLLMLIGMIEFGRALMVQQTLTTAAREGAREAALPGATVSSVEDVATSMLTSSEGATVTVSPDPESADPGDMITVTVDVPLSAVTKMGALWFESGTTLDGNSSMRKEGYD